MTPRKRSAELRPVGKDWLLANPWMSAKLSGRTGYFYTSPNHPVGYIWNDPVLRYHHEFLDRGHRSRQTYSRNRMANVVPWLLSMSLLGVGEFATRTGSDIIARDLQAPFPSGSGFERSIPSYDEYHNHHTTCQPPLIDNTGVTSDESTEHSNHLYGMTPDFHSITKPYGSTGVVPRPGGRAIDIFKNGAPTVNQLGFPTFNHGFGKGKIEEEYVGPAMELMYAWSTVDFEYDSIEARDSAIFDGDFVAENNLPLGLDVWKDKVFISLPRWKDGIPATLATVPRYSKTKSPKLRPYPNWGWHHLGNCDGLTSVFRMQVDECDRLWVLDSGKTHLTQKAKQVCPPALFIFDLHTDTLVRKYTFPEDQNKEDSLFTNIVVDIRNNDCGGAVAYMSDVWRFGIVVYDFFKDTSFRVEHHFFFPDPLASRYDLHGIKFQWTDGIFGIALSPVDIHDDRTLFFHPMSSFREFAVSTSVFRDKRTAESSNEKFTPIGRPRAKDYGHSSGSVIDRHGVMFFNMVTRDSVWCWDTRKEYIPQNLGVIGTSNESLIFPNDIRVDHEPEQSVWLISNRLPMYLYGRFDAGAINYRVYRAYVKNAVRDTVCDPNYVVPDSDTGYDETC